MKEKINLVNKNDLRIDTFRSGGPGGQNQNKRDTGVRITHPESSAVGESREARGQLENKRRAFRRMAEHWKFKLWLQKKLGREIPETTSTRRYTYKEPNISFEGRKMDRDG